MQRPSVILKYESQSVVNLATAFVFLSEIGTNDSGGDWKKGSGYCYLGQKKKMSVSGNPTDSDLNRRLNEILLEFKKKKKKKKKLKFFKVVFDFL